VHLINPDVAFPALELDLQCLAAPGQLQTAWLMAEGVPIDELFQQFGDSMVVFVPGLIEHGLVDARAAEAIRAVNTQWEVMRASRDRRIWIAYAALDDTPEWQRARHLARAALDALGWSPPGYDVLAHVRAALMLKAVRHLVQRLAWPADALGPWLDWAGLPVPEIPLMLDACGSVLVPRLMSAGLISPEAAAAATALRDFVQDAAVSRDPALADPAPLATSPTWVTIRELARTAGDALGSVA
jgi:hypothetical protein